eukprot:TCONS_00059727-protein
MAVESNTRSSFSFDGNYFALLSIDNRLRIWDVASGKLLREYSSTDDVESTCTCLCWTRNLDPKSKDGRKRKKEKGKREQLSSLLIGYRNGGLVAYNSNSDQLEQNYRDGHSKKVNCIDYNYSNNNFYSCSDDKHIVEWNIHTKELISKWKAGKSAINRVAVTPSGKNLLSAGMVIKLWDLETKKEIMKFDGHASPVSILQFSGYRSPNKTSDDDDGCYFLSGSLEDRQISSWQINHSQPDKSTVASFVTNEIPLYLSVALEKDSKPVKMVVGCQNGTVHFYEFQMNGKVQRPLEPSKSLSLSLKDGNKNIPANLYGGYVENLQGDLTTKIANGSSVQMDFNSFNFTEAGKEESITKDLSSNLFMKEHSKISKKPVELAQIRGKQHVIGSTFTAPAKIPKLDINDNLQDLQKTDMSMVERLKNLKDNEFGQMTNAGSISVLLTQGLHTKDTKLLDEVISKQYHVNVIKNTLKRMSASDAVKLLILIVDQIHHQPKLMVFNNMMAWTKNILAIHLSSILLMSDVGDATGKLFNLLKAQQETYPALFSFQGKVDLLISQVSKTPDETKTEKAQEEDLLNPCVVFHDDSDDEDILDRVRRDDEDVSESSPEQQEVEEGDKMGSDGEEESDAVSSSDDEEEMKVGGKGDEKDDSSDSGTF